jgi:hypothetical protein
MFEITSILSKAHSTPSTDAHLIQILVVFVCSHTATILLTKSYLLNISRSQIDIVLNVLSSLSHFAKLECTFITA